MTLDRLLPIYHGLPPVLQSAAARLRGYYLRSWRYGPETDRLVEGALERDSWSEAQWARWRAERLAFVLHRAATVVPYYRRYWEDRRRSGDLVSWQELSNWPVLRKEDVRRRPEDFVAQDRDVRSLYAEHTSGTTGTPLKVWWSRDSVRSWFALFEARIRRWNGVSRYDRWAILGGQLVVPVERRKPPFWVWNAPLRQLYLSSYHLSPATAEVYLDAMREHRVRYLLGYPSAMSVLARLSLERGLEAPELRVAISNAEPLLESQRADISRAFRCPIRDTYGMAEVVCGASECSSSSLHLWPEAGIVEVLTEDSERPAPCGEVGRLVATGLLNADMLLVRYELGDRAALLAEGEPCACGRRLPRLASLEGRADDVLQTPDGRRIGRLDPVFKADLAVREAQIIQERVDLVRVLVVPADGFAEHDEALIREGLRSRLGPSVRINVETVPSIARSANGKFRAVVSRVARGHEA